MAKVAALSKAAATFATPVGFDALVPHDMVSGTTCLREYFLAYFALQYLVEPSSLCIDLVCFNEISADYLHLIYRAVASSNPNCESFIRLVCI